jgi:hypothetical protein
VTDQVSVWHKDDIAFRRAIADGDEYLFSTIASNSETPQVHIHAASACGSWKRSGGSTADNVFTGRYYKGTSKSLIALYQYVEKRWPRRPKRICGCVRVALADALAAAPTISSSATELEEARSPKNVWATLLEARDRLARELHVPPDHLEITIRTPTGPRTPTS